MRALVAACMMLLVQTLKLSYLILIHVLDHRPWVSMPFYIFSLLAVLISFFLHHGPKNIERGLQPAFVAGIEIFGNKSSRSNVLPSTSYILENL